MIQALGVLSMHTEKMIQKRYIHDIVDVSLFLYSLGMNTDYMIRLQMCGFTRLEAIILMDELIDDGEEVVETIIKAMEKEKRDVRVLQSEPCWQKGW